MLLGVVDQAAMLFAEEHELRRFSTFDVRQVNVDEHEDDEHEHAKVMDDADRHGTAPSSNQPLAEAELHRRSPQAQTGDEHQNDQNRNEQVGKLLRNAQLGGQRMILLEEQIVLDPCAGLMAIVLLGQPGLEVLNLFASAACRSGLHEEGHDDASEAVDENHKAEEHMQTTDDTHGASNREVDHEAGDDEEDHGNCIDPVGDHERQRMSFLIVCEMRHATSPPKDS